jgi:hypothetical protein
VTPVALSEQNLIDYHGDHADLGCTISMDNTKLGREEPCSGTDQFYQAVVNLQHECNDDVKEVSSVPVDVPAEE